MSACPNLATLPSMRPHLNVRDSRGSASCLVALCSVTSHAPHHPRLCQTSRTSAANYHAIVVHLADSALLTIRCKLQKLNLCPGICLPVAHESITALRCCHGSFSSFLVAWHVMLFLHLDALTVASTVDAVFLHCLLLITLYTFLLLLLLVTVILLFTCRRTTIHGLRVHGLVPSHDCKSRLEHRM